MTRFFLAGRGERTEAAYGELRERSRLDFGCAAKRRRIFQLECRMDGHDAVIEVGRPLPGGEGIVVAIFDHGRDEAFAVYTDAGEDCAIRVGHPVYSVTEFS